MEAHRSLILGLFLMMLFATSLGRADTRYSDAYVAHGCGGFVELPGSCVYDASADLAARRLEGHARAVSPDSGALPGGSYTDAESGFTIHTTLPSVAPSVDVTIAYTVVRAAYEIGGGKLRWATGQVWIQAIASHDNPDATCQCRADGTADIISSGALPGQVQPGSGTVTFTIVNESGDAVPAGDFSIKVRLFLEGSLLSPTTPSNPWLGDWGYADTSATLTIDAVGLAVGS